MAKQEVYKQATVKLYTTEKNKHFPKVGTEIECSVPIAMVLVEKGFASETKPSKSEA